MRLIPLRVALHEANTMRVALHEADTLRVALHEADTPEGSTAYH